MSNAWNGQIAIDIRDAVPDWTPYVQPSAGDGAPNVLMIAPSPDPEVRAPASFHGGNIEGVVVDVSGDPWLDHELEVQSYLARD